MKKAFLLLLAPVCLFITANAQVSLGTMPTISFANQTGFADNIAEDGEGGSVAISNLNLQVMPITNSGAKLSTQPLQYHDNNDWVGYPPIVTFGDGAEPNYGWAIKSADGTNFSLLSVDFNDWGMVQQDLFKIQAFDGGVLKGTMTFTGNANFGDYVPLSQSSLTPALRLPAAFGDVDEVRISMNDNTGSYAALNNIRVAPINTVLPLKLLSFTAASTGNAVGLSWRTSGEMNFSHFEIERSADGQRFRSIDAVAGMATSGIYRYTDQTIPTATTYYRLRMVNRDGSATFSSTVLVKAEALTVELYPNPATDVLQVTVPKIPAGLVTVQVINAAGRVVMNETWMGTGQSFIMPLAVDQLTAGNYFVEIASKAGKTVARFVKQ